MAEQLHVDDRREATGPAWYRGVVPAALASAALAAPVGYAAVNLTVEAKPANAAVTNYHTGATPAFNAYGIGNTYARTHRVACYGASEGKSYQTAAWYEKVGGGPRLDYTVKDCANQIINAYFPYVGPNDFWCSNQSTQQIYLDCTIYDS